MLAIQIAAFLILIALEVVHCDVCYVCPSTVYSSLCTRQYDCGFGVGCFTQSWIDSGVKMYQKGCVPSSTTCEYLEEAYCAPTSTLKCCSGDYCNSFDPMSSWVPNSPRNLISTATTPTTVTLQWTNRCSRLYTYQLDYVSLGAANIQTVSNIQLNQLTVTSLLAGTTYMFTMRSVYNNALSDAATVTATTQSATGTTSTTSPQSASYCWRTESNNAAAQLSTVITCPNFGDYCYSRFDYVAGETEPRISRGCLSQSQCDEANRLNENSCRPGVAGQYCHFCCQRASCNTFDWTYSQLTCDNIAQAERIQCGTMGTTADSCRARGCCYEFTSTSTFSCFHGRYTNVSGAALSFWVIIIIVLAILIIIIIVIIIVYCCRRRRKDERRGFYDVYSVPRKNRERTVATVSREAYDNTDISEA